MKKVLTIAAVVMLVTGVSSANLLLNGDFEADVDLFNWFKNAGAAEVQQNGNLAPGTDCAELDHGDSLRSLATEVTEGMDYTLQYEYKGGQTMQSWVRYFTGKDQYNNAIGWVSEDYLQGGNQADWQTMTLDVTIPTGQGINYVDIRLYSDGATALVDNVSFVPEPATMLLLAAGGLLIRRKSA